MANPNEILDRLNRDEELMNAETDRLRRVAQLFAKNKYSGKYRNQFEGVYEDILEVHDVVKEKFIDGFQFSDVEDIIVAASPVLKGIYDEFYYILKDEKEALVFLTELVIFIYYEIEDNIKVWGWLKAIFRLVFKVWAAGKIAKYLKMAFDYVDGNVTNLTNKVKTKVDKYLEVLE